MFILTVLIIRELRKATKERNRMAANANDSQSSDADTMLIVVIIICIVCQPWEPIRRIMEALLDRQPGCGHYYFYYEEFPSLSFAINSAANFVVYCLLGSRFRTALKQSVCGRWTGKNRESGSEGSVSAATTVSTIADVKEPNKDIAIDTHI